MTSRNIIFHITHRSEWEAAQAQGEYMTPSLESEGFIHFSTLAQVIATANAFYHGQSDLVLLMVDISRLRPDLQWEDPAHPNPEAVPETQGLFPHLYGPLNLKAVVQVIDFPPRADGTFVLPDSLVK